MSYLQTWECRDCGEVTDNPLSGAWLQRAVICKGCGSDLKVQMEKQALNHLKEEIGKAKPA